jgi:hypothetical protein
MGRPSFHFNLGSPQSGKYLSDNNYSKQVVSDSILWHAGQLKHDTH